MQDVLAITRQLAQVCERLGLRYVVGGSIASSLHGFPRSTQDVDLVIEIAQRDVASFAGALRDTFYLDEDAIRDAIARSSSFNVVHLESYFKADVFVAKDDEPSRLQMSRAQHHDLGGQSIVVASAEDVVAQKLYWYQLGDRVSERQWSDAIGVLKVSGPTLDLTYLRHVSSLLGVESLLRRACEEAGVSLPRA